MSAKFVVGNIDFAEYTRQNHLAFNPFRWRAIIVFIDLNLRPVLLCGLDHLVRPAEICVDRRLGAVTHAMFRTQQSRDMIIAGGNYDGANIRLLFFQHLSGICVCSNAILCALCFDRICAYIANGNQFKVVLQLSDERKINACSTISCADMCNFELVH